MSRNLLTVAGAVLLLQFAVPCLHAQETPDQARLLNNLRNLRSDLEQNPDYILEREYFSAINHLLGPGDRPRCLEACQEFLRKHPESKFTVPLQGLVNSLQRDAQRPPPAALAIPEAQRTLEQRIECLIFELRDLSAQPISTPGQPLLHDTWGSSSAISRSPYVHLFEIGPPAIPYLIAALDDDTPTRTTDYRSMGFRGHFVWRRQDIAMKCLEAISACRFYYRTELHRETPERRQAAIDNVHKWRELSAGKSQVESIRIQLELSRSNPTVRDYERLQMLETLGKIAGPQEVLAELREMETIALQPQPPLPGVDLRIRELTDPSRQIPGVLKIFDQPRYVHSLFRRFWDNSLLDLEHSQVLRYGDRRTYQEIVRRLESPETLDPEKWFDGITIGIAASNGREWSIPILAHLLTRTEITSTRHVGNETQQVSQADYAIGPFQELTGFDAGYRAELPPAERMAAIGRAREWWLATGQHSLREKIATGRSNADVVGDLLMTEDVRANLELRLISSNPEIRRRAVGELTFVRGWSTRNALWQSLRMDSLPEERQRILKVLLASPVNWELQPSLEYFLSETDPQTQELAAELLAAIWVKLRTDTWQLRLEVRDNARQRLQDYRVQRNLDSRTLPAAVDEQLDKILKD